MMIASPILRLSCKIATFLLYALTIIASSSGKMNPEYFTFPSILNLVLPYLIIITLVVIIIWACLRRWIIVGIGVATIILCSGAARMVTPIGFSSKAPEGSVTFTLLTFNCLHFEDLRQPDYPGNRAVEFLIHSGADIICLQELETFFHKWEMKHPIPPQQLDSLKKVYPYWAELKGWCDLRVLSKYPVRQDYEMEEPPSWPPDYAFFNVNIKGKNLRLVNAHLTSYDLSAEERNVVSNAKTVRGAKTSVKEFKTSIYSKMKKSFRERGQVASRLVGELENYTGPVIICGDFNDVPASWAYRKFLNAGFHDAYTETSFGPVTTYNQHFFFFHLDQILYRGDLMPLNCKRIKLDTSDHYPVMTQFAFI